MDPNIKLKKETKNLKINILQFKNINFNYPEKKQVLNFKNLSFKNKSIVGIYGPSGSGKNYFFRYCLRFNYYE